MVQGKMSDDIAWMASLHGESMINKVKDERHFADYMCQVGLRHLKLGLKYYTLPLAYYLIVGGGSFL